MAYKILVSLVSKQTIPNIEFIKEMSKETQKYLFISTKEMESQGLTDCIKRASGLNPSDILGLIIVDPYSFDGIEKSLDESSYVTDENEYIVNITGGTKVMSLAVFEYFKDFSSKIYYLTGQGGYIKLHPGKNKREITLKSKVSLKEYLTAYGFEIVSKESPFSNRNVVRNMLDYFLKNGGHKANRSVLGLLRERRNKGVKNIDEVEGLNEFLSEIEFNPKESGSLSKYECKFLTGGWFEEYVYYFLVDRFNFSDDEIGLGWIIRKNDIRNEFDLLMIRDNKIYTVECKTSVYLDESKTKNIVSETIYKVDSLKSRLGLLARAALVTLSPLDAERLKDPLKRADDAKIKVAGRKVFEDEKLEQFFKQL